MKRCEVNPTALAALCAALLLSPAAFGAPEFFVLDNGVGRGSWTPEQQAKTLKELGYDGIGYNYTKPADLAQWQQAFKRQGLKIYSLYVYTFIDKPVHYDRAFKEAVKLLKGSDTVIWMTLRETAVKGNHDAEAVKLVQEMADLAQENGLRVALYGHAGYYVATANDAVRIVKQVNRANVGVTINLCHEFMTKNGGQLQETLKNAAPYLMLVTINGVDVKNQKYILRLDEGDFDVAGWLKKLQAAGYKGPVGLQCFGVKGDTTENLKADMTAWKGIRETLCQNTLTQKEASAGWRGYNESAFPDHGWCIEDGCLKSLGQKGGDIVTTGVFTNFELSWEWRIAPQANSGLKYFVSENRQAANGDPTNPDPCIAHEYQMVDDDHYPDPLSAKQKTAAWYAVMAPENAKPNPVGEFNQSRLIVCGKKVEHWLNGKRVLTYQTDSAEGAASIADSKFKDVAGYGDKVPTPILLQDHNSVAWVRNIRLRELP